MSKCKTMSLNNALIHDKNEAHAGQLRRVTDFGCELHVACATNPWGPVFNRGRELTLNVLSEDESVAEAIPVSLDGIRKCPQAWIYRLNFERKPKLAAPSQDTESTR